MCARIVCAAAAALGLLAAGCGSSDTVFVTGKLIRSDRPLVPAPSQSLAVTFRPIDTSPRPAAGAGDVYPARMNRDGSFEVPGPEGRGIPKGKYRVTLVLRRKPNPAKPNLPSRPHGPVENREKDWLQGQFDETNSPIVRQVDGAQELIIDLDKPTG